MTRRDRHEHPPRAEARSEKPPHESQDPPGAARPDGSDATAAAPPEGPAAAGPEAAGEAGAASTDSAGQYKDRWLRAEAELQNFRRRSMREWEEGRRNAEERVMLEMITAIDDLDRALEAARASGAADTWTEGVRLTAQRLREYLARQGVTTLEPLGEKFDPAFHEAMLEVDAPDGREAGDVVQVVLKGYARGGRPLRPARVVVARAPAGREA